MHIEISQLDDTRKFDQSKKINLHVFAIDDSVDIVIRDYVTRNFAKNLELRVDQKHRSSNEVEREIIANRFCR